MTGPRSTLWSAAVALGILALLLAPGAWVTPSAGASKLSTTPVAGSVLGVSPSLAELRSGSWVTIPYSEPGFQLSGAVAGRVADIPSMTVVLTLSFTDAPALGQLLASLQDPSSPQYHRYLSAAAFDQEFGGALGTYEALVSYFQESGASAVTSYADRVTITVLANSAVVDGIFSVSIEEYTSNGLPYYAPQSAPKLPASLAGTVDSVVGLSSYSQYLIHTDLTHSTLHAPGVAAPPSIEAAGYLSPASYMGFQMEYAPDLQVAYDESSLFDQYGYPTNSVIATLLWGGKYGGGGTAALCAALTVGQTLGGFVPSDVSAFFNETLPAGEPHPTVHGVPLAGAYGPGPNASCDTTGAYEENTLDLEMAGSLAPGANIYNVYGRNATSASLDNAFAFVLNPIGYPALKNVSVISNSWGSPEYNDSGWYSDLQIAEARGISVLASTGDAADNPSSPKWPGGPANDFVQFPAGEAFNTFGTIAVGGTTLTLSTSTLQIADEIAWNDSSLKIGSEGGISHRFNETDWQNGSASANSTLKGAGRGVPDLAAIANNTLVTLSVEGYQYNATNATSGGAFDEVSGTSVACPVEAGIVAEIDHVLHAAGNGNLGFFDPGLYEVENEQHAQLTYSATTGFYPTGPYNSPLPTLPVRDTVKGSNDKFHAKPGWDLVTGWGSLDAYNYTMYILNVSSVGVPGHLSGVDDDLNLTNLQVTTPGNPYYNASFQQNFFVADSLGAPVYWIQNVIYVNWSSGWSMSDSGWVVFPFYGQYPALTDYEYNFPLAGTVVPMPATFNISTNLTVPQGPNSAVVTFSVNSNVVSLSVPGGAYILGSLWDNYSWQGTTYENGPYPGNPVPGGLSPQFGLVGGPSGGTGHYATPTAGSLSAWLRPFGSTPWITPATATFGYATTQTGESALNLAWTRVAGSSNNWTLGVSAGSRVQGVLAYEPPTYNATFHETGLPGGTEWFVNATNSAGVAYAGASASTQIGLALPNGTYTFSASSVSPGYRASPGSVTVVGANVTTPVPFTIIGYNATFTESGLPAGFDWYVNLTNASGPVVDLGGTQSSLVVNLPNGEYNFTLASRDKRWTPTPGYIGTFNVTGAAVPESASFEEVVFRLSFAESGLPYGADPWYVNATNGTGSTSSVVSMNGYANLTLPNGTYTYLVRSGGLQWGPDPASGLLHFHGNRSIPVVFSEQLFTVIFQETGLPVGTEWYVNGSAPAWQSAGTTSSTVTSLPNGTFAYAVATVNKTFEPSGRPTPVEVAGTTATVLLQFVPVTYAVQFLEGGALPATVTWYVNVTGEPSIAGHVASENASLTNGTFQYTIASADKRYQPTPSAGRLDVDGGSGNVSILFRELLFTVNFTESGLPSPTAWYVNVSGELQPSAAGLPVAFVLSNGSFPYTITSANAQWVPTPATGSVHIAGPSPNVSVVFNRIVIIPSFNTTFSTEGLPDGIPWYVNVTGGPSLAGLGTQITQPFRNGSYSYVVASADHRWSPNVTTATFTVNGAPRGFPLRFHAVTFGVSFQEIGLPAGLAWTVNFNGSTNDSTAPSVIFPAVQNGTYAYAVTSVAGYTVSSAGGPVVVQGQAVQVKLTFTPTSGGGGSGGSGGTSSFGPIPWWVWLLLVVGAAGIVLSLVLRSRRREEPPPMGLTVPPPAPPAAPNPPPAAAVPDPPWHEGPPTAPPTSP